MKICQVVPSLDERHGGPSKSVHELSAALARAGHKAELLSVAPGRDELRPLSPFPLRIHPQGWPEFLCTSPGLRRDLEKSDAEVIHHHSLWLRTLHYAHRASRRKNVPLVISPRGMMNRWAWNHRESRKLLARLFVHPGALRGASGWHATSEQEAASIRALGFSQPVCVAPNGVSAPTADDAAASARFWREACPETATRPVALFYGRFHRKKRVVELIDAWLEQGNRDWLLLLVGIPEEYSVEMIEDYVLRASGLDRVRVYSGLGHPPPYAVASLFLLASHDENFGLAIAEAMANGIPALVTDSTPWSQINEHGGWCVPWDQFPGTLRSALAEGGSRLRERGSTARDWVLSQYSWDKPARALADFYAGLKGAAS